MEPEQGARGAAGQLRRPRGPVRAPAPPSAATARLITMRPAGRLRRTADVVCVEASVLLEITVQVHTSTAARARSCHARLLSRFAALGLTPCRWSVCY